MNEQELKNKYQPVADFMSGNGFQVQHFHVENGKVVLDGGSPYRIPQKSSVGRDQEGRLELRRLAAQCNRGLRHYVHRQSWRQFV